MNKLDLQKTLQSHSLWISSNHQQGNQANFSGADLCGADFSKADLCWADFSEADLRGANFSKADLCGADFSEADLRGANFSGADLRWADLRGADFSEADLSKAILRGANFSEANFSGAKNIPSLHWTILCPDGDLIVWKKVSNGIAKLLIPKEAKRVNATSRKCRAEFAIVLDCPAGAVSILDSSFKYKIGEKVIPHTFDKNRWNECSGGIHFFLTKEEAQEY